jgi:hypothetical protein
MLVLRWGLKRSLHLAHIVRPNKPCNGHITCKETIQHSYAKRLLLEFFNVHHGKIVYDCTNCPECHESRPSVAFAVGSADVGRPDTFRSEVTVKSGDKSVRFDVAGVTGANEAVVCGIEVRHTHATEPTDQVRGTVPWIEVDAVDDVLVRLDVRDVPRSITVKGDRYPITHRCNRDRNQPPARNNCYSST